MIKQNLKLNTVEKNKKRLENFNFNYNYKLRMVFIILVISLFSVSCAKVTDDLSGNQEEIITKLTQDDTDANANTQTADATSIAAADMAVFKTTLYPVLTQYCQGCHNQSGFADFADTDLQTAYDTATSKTYVNLSNAQNSEFYKKILRDPHKCTFPTCQTWADEIVGAIESWANYDPNTDSAANTVDDSSDVVNNIVDENEILPDANPNLDSTSAQQKSAFEMNLYPVLTNQCSGSGCHSTTQSPKFAHPDISVAFSAVISKVNLSSPVNSRLVEKPLTIHNCVGAVCQTWSDNIKTGIEDWANAVVGNIAGAGITNSSIKSKTLTWKDKVLVKSDGRVEDAIIAKYDFKTGSGLTAFDTSGVSPSLDLTLNSNADGVSTVRWLKGGGVELTDPDAKAHTRLVGGEAASQKLYNMIAAPGASKEFSVEAWIINRDKAIDGPARIVTYSFNSGRRNFTMGQNTDYYNFRNSTRLTGPNGSKPALETNNDNDDLKEQLQHVVMTFTENEGRKIYVNGIETSYEGVVKDEAAGPENSIFDGWQKNFVEVNDLGEVVKTTPYIFLLGNERARVERQWLGKMLFVAVHNRALTKEEVLRNTLEGIGEKFIFTFDISELLDASGNTTSSIKMLVSELDEFSYVFGTPTLVTNIVSPNIPVKNMRIAVNGTIPVAAQAFKNMNISAITAETKLSQLGAVIPKDIDADTDVFSLVFEQLGNNTNVVVEQPVVIVPEVPNNPVSPKIGVRTFEQINNTMSVLTGVDKNDPNISFDLLKEQLPTTPLVDAFVSSQQIGIAKLSLDYCNLMIDDEPLRTAFFGNGFDFTLPPFSAFAGANKDIITTALVTNMIGTNLTDQPTLAEVKTEVDVLFNELLTTCTDDASCLPDVTLSVVKAACAAVMASAAVTIN